MIAEMGKWTPGQIPEMRAKRILDFIADRYGIAPEKILDHDRHEPLKWYRMVAYYFVRHCAMHTTVGVERFMNRSHNSVAPGLRTLQNRIDTEPKFRAEMEALATEVREMLEAQ